MVRSGPSPFVKHRNRRLLSNIETVAFCQSSKPSPWGKGSPIANSCRFLKTVQSIPCAILDLGGNTVSVYNFRRIQITEQHVERQRKNILQKCLIFTQRTHELLQDTPLKQFKQIISYHLIKFPQRMMRSEIHQSANYIGFY